MEWNENNEWFIDLDNVHFSDSIDVAYYNPDALEEFVTVDEENTWKE